MVSHIVSDMGGVLVQIEWQQRVAALLGQPISLDELHHLWVTAASTLAFETGQIDFAEFAQAFIAEFDLSVSAEHLMSEFLQVVQAPMPNCQTVLAALKQDFHLSLLSNTNPAHYEKLQSRYGFFDPFDQLFLSFQIGLMKPDEQIFHHVIKALGTDPENIVFFDDGRRNVEVARSIGIQAFQVDSPDALWQVMQPFSAAADKTGPYTPTS
ncbi:HAD family phosphatase [Pseudanabaena sp. FACHB-2040]|uniref:HAD family hydrolase n=1 Tax=Pseudanabaena sp. FACHB-2040 TaxID=2692859 RepID=UPI001689C8BC|nr:HAD family phosphatase [Pseudanabaena sp. FACHB-2040]MBD2259888.1 HAD family phosphatase [Pseudanabaena sp. FACHB-2040]